MKISLLFFILRMILIFRNKFEFFLLIKKFSNRRDEIKKAWFKIYSSIKFQIQIFDSDLVFARFFQISFLNFRFLVFLIIFSKCNFLYESLVWSSFFRLRFNYTVQNFFFIYQFRISFLFIMNHSKSRARAVMLSFI